MMDLVAYKFITYKSTYIRTREYENLYFSLHGDVVFLEINFIKKTSTKWFVNCPGPCPYSVYFVFVSTTLVTNKPTSVRPAPKMPSMQSGVLYLD